MDYNDDDIPCKKTKKIFLQKMSIKKFEYRNTRRTGKYHATVCFLCGHPLTEAIYEDYCNRCLLSGQVKAEKLKQVLPLIKSLALVVDLTGVNQVILGKRKHYEGTLIDL